MLDHHGLWTFPVIFHEFCSIFYWKSSSWSLDHCHFSFRRKTIFIFYFTWIDGPTIVHIIFFCHFLFWALTCLCLFLRSSVFFGFRIFFWRYFFLRLGRTQKRSEFPNHNDTNLYGGGRKMTRSPFHSSSETRRQTPRTKSMIFMST